MISVPGREVLQAMKRVDIQKLCKEYGVKANLKTEALIELLLHASQPQPPRRTLPQPLPRSTSVRIANQPGARPRGRSSGSVIIHDTDEEEEAIEDIEIEQQPEEHKPPPAPVDPAPRTRKAKDTQYRLGVGRPIIAGGSGARAVTKSVGVSRGSKRTKSIKNVKPSEDTIAEEPEPEPEPTPAVASSEQEGPSGTSLVPQPHSIPLQTHTAGMTGSSSSQIVENAVAAALAPVHKELEDQKAQLSELRDKVSSIIETFETQIRGLTVEIERLRAQPPGHTAEIQRHKEISQRIPNPPSTPKRVRSPVGSLGDVYVEQPEPSVTSSDSPNPNGLLGHQGGDTDNPNQAGSLLPGFHTTLGKRPRDSNTSTATAFFELGQEEELSEAEIVKRIARPAQKRAKLGLSDITEVADERSGPSLGAQGSQDTDAGPSQPSVGIVVPKFGDPGCQDSPPPTASLLDFFALPSPPLMNAPTAVGAPPDTFRFGYITTSTPARFTFPTAMGTFPHPEPPTSPSPANNVDRPRSRQSEHFGIFGHHRGSSGTTARSGSGGPTGGQESGVNPSMRAGTMQRQPSSNEVASGLGLTVLRTAATEEGTPVPPARRTMYGTELDSDTRFGDFGVEGVASGFWAGGRR
ncbi:hypothetical protein DEU56DRAFT_816095 [Suillus clintonianus]|uniref:uncharacterized protein n=1 Tax=Suillus clintonianus TaxID=1904413 RepID=UPI001B872A94|nr:uncharacterized protein DEU56DRAFT_816095 [Suillus clintonianus]KAG2129899.1 hypothetical protein DEU56DRAFT_816095 [Suillus clintonianus]